MKVLQINSVCGVGSTGRIATDIHAILEEQSHESYIAYGRDIPMNCDTTVRIGNDFDNYAHVLKTRIFDKHGFGSRKATKKFISEIKELDPDVIHLHNIHGYYINVEILFEFLKEANKPVIWTLHDCWAFTGHCTYFDFIGCDCWRIDGNHKCIQKRSYPASLLFNNSKKNFEKKRKAFTGIKNLTIVTPSNWLADLVKQSFLNEYPVKVINNGIDINAFKPLEGNFKEKFSIKDKFVILGVASIWEERKGLRYFLELSNQLKDEEVIVLVGLPEKQIEELPKNIIGISKTNNIKELAEIYSASNVFVNPTLEDNFPTTNLEALACGTPVVTFNTGGSPESIDENSGIIIKHKNVNELVKVLTKLKVDNFNSRDCVKRARAFNKEDRFNEYINLYKKVIS